MDCRCLALVAVVCWTLAVASPSLSLYPEPLQLATLHPTRLDNVQDYYNHLRSYVTKVKAMRQARMERLQRAQARNDYQKHLQLLKLTRIGRSVSMDSPAAKRPRS